MIERETSHTITFWEDVTPYVQAIMGNVVKKALAELCTCYKKDNYEHDKQRAQKMYKIVMHNEQNFFEAINTLEIELTNGKVISLWGAQGIMLTDK